MKPVNGQAYFKDFTGGRIDDVRLYIESWLRLNPNGEIFVGCDSKVRGNRVKYSTVICLWNVGHGVREIYRNEIMPTPKDSYTRLWEEVTKAVEAAEDIKDLKRNITVHIDINSNPQFQSHKLYDASIGLITALGFKGEGKPHSWAASCGAHRHCQ